MASATLVAGQPFVWRPSSSRSLALIAESLLSMMGAFDGAGSISLHGTSSMDAIQMWPASQANWLSFEWQGRRAWRFTYPAGSIGKVADLQSLTDRFIVRLRSIGRSPAAESLVFGHRRTSAAGKGSCSRWYLAASS